MGKIIRLKNDIYLSTKSIIHDNHRLIEKENWTPELACLDGAAPTVEYQNQKGLYTKIGNMVFFNFSIRGKITALNATNNYCLILGLPYLYNLNSSSAESNAISIGQLYNATASANNVNMIVRSAGIGIQRDYGTSPNVWKTSDDFYIDGAGFYILTEG